MQNPAISKNNADFWTSLLGMAKSQDGRRRLWNGYIGLRISSDNSFAIEHKIEPPDGAWPVLRKIELRRIETMAQEYGGHPELSAKFINFSDHTFEEEVDFSELVFINGSFRKAQFTYRAHFENTRFFGAADFYDARFKHQSLFCGARFHGSAHFDNSQFCFGCSFSGVSFEAAWFTEAQFIESGLPKNIAPGTLVDFTNARFTSLVDFRKAVFGTPGARIEGNVRPERVVDFSGARFKSRTSFYKSTIAGVPAFFNTHLYEDTDLGNVNWNRAAADRVSPNYAVRAWERLELIMSQLEKPLDRHRFFRFKMRARRRTDGYFLRVLNWIFEITSDYGWGLQRAFLTWLIHWAGFALVMFLNAPFRSNALDCWKVPFAALAIGFANAHAFLGLATDDGHLAPSRQLMESYDLLGLLPVIGTVQAVFGPILLFLLVLTFRNRFRLA